MLIIFRQFTKLMLLKENSTFYAAVYFYEFQSGQVIKEIIQNVNLNRNQGLEHEPECHELMWCVMRCPHETGGDVTSECHTSCHITANMSRRHTWHMTTQPQRTTKYNLLWSQSHWNYTGKCIFVFHILNVRSEVSSLTGTELAKAKGD